MIGSVRDDTDPAVEIVLAQQLETGIGLQQLVAVAAKPELAVRVCGRLNSQPGVATGDDVLLHETELGVVLVNVVFLEPLGQAANDEEAVPNICQASGSVDEFGRLVFADELVYSFSAFLGKLNFD